MHPVHVNYSKSARPDMCYVAPTCRCDGVCVLPVIGMAPTALVTRAFERGAHVTTPSSPQRQAQALGAMGCGAAGAATEAGQRLVVCLQQLVDAGALADIMLLLHAPDGADGKVMKCLQRSSDAVGKLRLSAMLGRGLPVSVSRDAAGHDPWLLHVVFGKSHIDQRSIRLSTVVQDAHCSRTSNE